MAFVPAIPLIFGVVQVGATAFWFANPWVDAVNFGATDEFVATIIFEPQWFCFRVCFRCSRRPHCCSYFRSCETFIVTDNLEPVINSNHFSIRRTHGHYIHLVNTTSEPRVTMLPRLLWVPWSFSWWFCYLSRNHRSDPHDNLCCRNYFPVFF